MTELNRCAHVLRCCPGAFEFPVGYVRSITRALLLPVGTVGTACIVDFSPTEACSLAPGRSSAGKILPGIPVHLRIVLETFMQGGWPGVPGHPPSGFGWGL